MSRVSQPTNAEEISDTEQGALVTTSVHQAIDDDEEDEDEDYSTEFGTELSHVTVHEADVHTMQREDGDLPETEHLQQPMLQTSQVSSESSVISSHPFCDWEPSLERPPIPQIEPSLSAEVETDAPMKPVKPPAVVQAFHPQAVISFADWITRVGRSRHKSPARSMPKEFRDFLIE